MKQFFLLLAIITPLAFLQAQVPQDRLCDWTRAGLTYDISENILSVNITDFGAIADDGLPDDEAFSLAMEHFNGDPGIILFPSGEFNFTESISIISGIVVNGESSEETILRCNLGGSGDLFNISGSIETQSQGILTARKNNNFIVLTEVGNQFINGDILKISMTGIGYMYSDWAMGCMAQIVEVESHSNDTVYLKNELRHNFYSENQAVVQKINPIRNVKISNLKIVREDATTTQTSNIQFNYAYNCNIRAIESENCNFAHISISNSTNIEVSGCYIHHGFDYGEGGKAYGTEISASSGECYVHNNIFEHLRHSMLLQSGANGNVLSYNYSFDPFWNQSPLPSTSAGDLVLHGNYPYCNLFEGNIAQNAVIDDSHGINGPYNTFYRNRLQKYGIVMNFNPATDSLTLVGNEVTNTSFLLGNYTIFGTEHFTFGNNIKGNCNPTATENIESSSLYLSDAPCYFESEDIWPSIGYPTAYNTNTVPAYQRFELEIMTFDTCTPDISMILENNTSSMIFPNPFEDSFSISSNSNVELLEIVDLSGRIISKHMPINQNNITLSLESGIYLLRITYADNLKEVIKIQRK